MSYTFHPVAVSVATIKKTCGSKDAKLIEKLVKKFGERFPGIDELDEDAVTMSKAIEDLVMGAKLNEDSGFKYGYALKFLCEHLGKPLPNEFWSDAGWDWVEDVDATLADAGIDKKVFRLDPHLTARSAPVTLPKINDFPAIGYVLAAEIAKILLVLPKSGDDAIEDEEIAQSLGQLREWFEECARTHMDLVSFYH